MRTMTVVRAEQSLSDGLPHALEAWVLANPKPRRSSTSTCEGPGKGLKLKQTWRRTSAGQRPGWSDSAYVDTAT